MSLDWDKLRIFHAAAEAKSFTHGGDKLGLSQSAVSRQVSALENELKVPLFHRHARGLLLTEQGELLFRTTQELFAKLESTKLLLTDSRERPHGVLKVTTSVGLGGGWLSPLLGEFMDLYPEIYVTLMLTDDELDLAMREADVGIRLRQPTQSELIQRKLFPVHYHVYASPDYLSRFGVPQTAADLESHRIVGFGGLVPTFLQPLNWLAYSGRDDSDPRQPNMSVNNMLGLKRAVEGGNI
jgi:DNA-binding transcriptional LysR family regulator